MGAMDTEGNNGRKQANSSQFIKADVAPWHQSETSPLGRGVTWADAPADLLCSLAAAVTSTGAALSLSATRDNRGVSLTILDGPDRPKFYASTPQELESLLRRLVGRP